METNLLLFIQISMETTIVFKARVCKSMGVSVSMCVRAYCLCLLALPVLSYHFRSFARFLSRILHKCLELVHRESMLKWLVSCCGTNNVVLFELRFVRCPVVLRHGPPICLPVCLPVCPSACLSVCLVGWPKDESSFGVI